MADVLSPREPILYVRLRHEWHTLKPGDLVYVANDLGGHIKTVWLVISIDRSVERLSGGWTHALTRITFMSREGLKTVSV